MRYKIKFRNTSHTILIILLFIWLPVLSNTPNANKTLSTVQDGDKQKVVSLIEKTYLYINNGSIFGIVNTTSSPFYNYDELSFFGILQSKELTSKGVVLKPKGYKFVRINNNIAEVDYDLFLMRGKDVFPTKTNKIHMVAKKIAGMWKLDCKEIFPILRLIKGQDNNVFIDSIGQKKKQGQNIKMQENEAIKRANAIEKALFGANPQDKKPSNDYSEKRIDYEPVNLNDYLSIINPKDTLTDWNYTELDENCISILKANHIFLKDDKWVREIKSENSTINKGLSINGRQLIGEMIKPIYYSDADGKITLLIRIDEKGDVIQVSIVSPTTITNSEVRNATIEAAKKNKFTTGNEVTSGTITYFFSLR
jgi:hypothetical protein